MLSLHKCRLPLGRIVPKEGGKKSQGFPSNLVETADTLLLYKM